MTYEENNLRKWLSEHPLISIYALEKEAELPRDTLNHFINRRRGFPEKHYDKLITILYGYGYKELNAE